MCKTIIVVVLLAITAATFAQINDKCLQCICKIESGCRPLGCAWDVNSNSCGYYQLKNVYWIDCGKPGGSLEACSKDKACSEKCVRAYMQRYGTRCTGGRTPTCQDYARIHNGGPTGCQKSATVGYWNKVAACYNSG
ncbi:unnamed protein product [Rotaria sp. Silwood2]|nr:unnamed protein product [Rotaria sp. Silwood2]CAF2542128.1 unnamed protein product [Rotaria sp. Silwood2]CAF2793921.1 unnamed protein product [Rotaria sp. Silwood2]CAF2922225.1 unnamed protein product [Rotaria sp. Silwood2]CAF4138033.1 unnamed protein product [Rotaria sp. Silwood2]